MKDNPGLLVCRTIHLHNALIQELWIQIERDLVASNVDGGLQAMGSHQLSLHQLPLIDH